MTAGLDPALDPPATRRTGTERELLDAWLDYHRQTLRWKCSNLTPEQLCTASAPPSGMSLLGLVRHMTDVENWWFVEVAAGREVPERYPEEDEDLTQADPATAAEDLAAYEAAVTPPARPLPRRTSTRWSSTRNATSRCPSGGSPCT